MAGTSLMGDNNGEDAEALFTDTLDANHRYIFPQAWVEANILPYMTEGPLCLLRRPPGFLQAGPM